MKSQAIQGSTEHLLLNALDNRAACFEKLGKYKQALRDAKCMIESMPKLSKVW
jgi:F-box/TPR repeat protein Pof3